MKAAEIIKIAEKWKRVFANTPTNPHSDLDQIKLRALVRLNQRFIAIMRAEAYINQSQVEFEAPLPTEMPPLSPLKLHLSHIKAVLSHYPSEILPADMQRWTSGTPHQLLVKTNKKLYLLSIVVSLARICHDLFLLWANQTTFAALLTLSHLSLCIAPLIVLGLWMLCNKYVFFPYDNHSFNLTHLPSSLHKDSILLGMSSNSNLSFFENPDHAALIGAINTEYQRPHSFGC